MFVKGLTSKHAAEILEETGYNELTPPKEIPEWLKLLRSMTEGFALLLWAGGILCFIAYGVQCEEMKGGEVPVDNVSTSYHMSLSLIVDIIYLISVLVDIRCLLSFLVDIIYFISILDDITCLLLLRVDITCLLSLLVDITYLLSLLVDITCLSSLLVDITSFITSC